MPCPDRVHPLDEENRFMKTPAAGRSTAPTSPIRPAASDARPEARLRAALAARLGEDRYHRWFGDAEIRIDERGVEVRTTGAFAKRMLDHALSLELREVAEDLLGHGTDIRVAIAPSPRAARGSAGGDVERVPSAAPMRTQPVSGPPAGGISGIRPGSRTTRPEHGFRDLEDFVVGTSNRLAWMAALQTADPRDHPPAGIMFMHGDCGVGKTHLLQGICRRYSAIANASGADARVRYVTGEQFTNEFIAAVRDSRIEQFRERVRRLDLLAIDDIHFLENKVRTQNELLHTLDAIGLTGARIVLASDGHPSLIRRCSRSLVNRFLSGMVIEVERPDRETRRQIAQRLSARRGLRLGEAAVEAVASRCVGSVREIEGAMTKIAAMHQLLSVRDGRGGGPEDEVGLSLVEQVLHETGGRPARPVQVGGLIEAAAERLGLTRSEIVGGSRRGLSSLGRSIVSLLAKEMTGHSYPEIARGLGLASHASVHRAVQTTRRRIDERERVRDVDGSWIELRELVDQIRHTAAAEATRQAR
jgi:chromosomal replication initiator protein